jgi:hypothetical protein
MSVSTERITDQELLALCELANEIHGQTVLGKPLTEAEDKFLALLERLELWSLGE